MDGVEVFIGSVSVKNWQQFDQFEVVYFRFKVFVEENVC